MDTSTLRTILVSLDGSALDDDVLPVVQALALATGARAVVLRVVRERGPGEPHERDEAEQSVGRAADRLRAAGVVVVAEACAGARAACVLRHALLWRAGLIVVADPARGLATRLLRGGGSREALVRASPVPVLLVPARSAAAPATGGSAVLAVVDESSDDASVVAEAASLARALSLGVVLLRVVTAPPVVAMEYAALLPAADDLLAEARDYARGLALDLRRRSAVPASGEAAVGPSIDAIVERAEAWDAAAIVLGRGWSTGCFPRLGSVADRVLARTSRPLVVPPVARSGGGVLPRARPAGSDGGGATARRSADRALGPAAD
jgi:nucleotide-binding universal stress UspA family protein